MPSFVVPSMTITISATRTATSIDVSGLIVCDAPVSGNPAGPARMDLFIGGQYVGNTYGGPVAEQPYHRQYTFSAPLASILDSEIASSVVFVLYDAATRRRASGDLPVTIAASPVPQVVQGKVLRTLFWNDYNDFVANPARATQFRDAGINAITMSVFTNPVWTGGGITTYQQWLDQTVLNPTGLQAKIDWCIAEGFYFIGSGDDICRTQTERDWVANTPWAQQAIEETASRLAAGPCPYVAMVDEMGGLPTDYPVLASIMSWWRGANGQKVGFPFQRLPGDPFEALPYSDVNDRFWSRLVGGGNADWSDTRWQCLDGIQRASTGQPVSGRPFICQIGAMGAHYFKLVNGSEYQPGQDMLQDGGVVTPANISAQVKAAMAYGASGLRVYAYDLNGPMNRGNASIGSLLQTGIQIGSPKWTALSESLNWVKDNEAALCGPYLPPVVSGGTITGRRDGLSWVVDLLD